MFAIIALRKLQDLFTLRENTDCDTHDLINCSCTGLGTGSAPELDDYEFDQDDERDCQLGSTTGNKSKDVHKTVDQLLEWQHYGTPFASGVFQVRLKQKMKI